MSGTDSFPVPSHQCAVAVKGNKQYLFVALPKAPPPPPPVIEDLFVFDSAPSPTPAVSAAPADGPQCGTGSKYLPGSLWRYGLTVVPLQIASSGDIQRSLDFKQAEFASFREVQEQCGPFQEFAPFYALFGAILLDRVYVLVATNVQVGAHLPHTGVIWKVVETLWVPFDLPGVAPLRVSSGDRDRLNEFSEHKYFKGYYYSLAVDVRLPFPFCRSDSVANALPDFKCDWSEHLRKPFKAASLKSACAVLVRGFVGSRVTPLKDNSELHMMLLGRQNTLNPGPRYLGRGLNAVNGAGNDHFYEYIVWRHMKPGTSTAGSGGGGARPSDDTNPITFARHAILRGTIPVHWTTKVSSVSLSEPAMIFSADKNEVTKGSAAYFQRVFETLQRTMGVDSNGTTGGAPQLRCISLLRLNQQHGEDVLARHYVEAVKAADPEVKRLFPNGRLDLAHVDWLNLIKDYGIDVATSSFWETSMSFLGRPSTADDSMMSVGWIDPASGAVDRLVTQSRFVRINCADSLDRTNLGCFFTCLQATIGMLVTLQVPFDGFSTDIPPLPPLDANADQYGLDAQYAGAFAPVTTAKQPVARPFVSTWKEARDPRRIPSVVARLLAELFVHNGDCVAMLYTNSAAMHGNILRGLCGMRAAGSNAVIATQRKFENVFEDHKKFRSIELLLGRNQDVHFPSMSVVFLTRPVPYQQWSCAVIGVGIPSGVQISEVDAAVRQSWDTEVVPWLKQAGQVPIESSALCLSIALSETLDAHGAYADAVNQVSYSDDPSTSPSTRNVPDLSDDPSFAEEKSVATRSEHIVVVEFDPNLCQAVNVPALLRQYGRLTLRGRNCILAPYSYPIQTDSDGSGGGGSAFSKVGTSFKKGFKNFVRGLN